MLSFKSEDREFAPPLFKKLLLLAFIFKDCVKRMAKKPGIIVISKWMAHFTAIYARFFVYHPWIEKLFHAVVVLGTTRKFLSTQVQLQSAVYTVQCSRCLLVGLYQSRNSYAQSSWVLLPRLTAMKNKSRFHGVKIKLFKSWVINAKTQNRFNLFSAWKSKGALKTIDP